MPVLYALPLQKPTAITCAVLGSFSALKQQELVVCRGGKVLEMLRVESPAGELSTTLMPSFSAEVFGSVCSMETIHFPKSGLCDCLLVGTDTGRVVILQYMGTESAASPGGAFVVVHQEGPGRAPAMQRFVPGPFLAVDPRGRGIMVAAVESLRFIHRIDREDMSVSSPLCAHSEKPSVMHALAGVDGGSSSSVLFVSIEEEFEVEVGEGRQNGRTDEGEGNPSSVEEKREKKKSSRLVLFLYHLDLEANWVIRRAVRPLPFSAHALIPLPLTRPGSCGVLVACAGFLLLLDDILSSPSSSSSAAVVNENQATAVCAFPRRLESPAYEVKWTGTGASEEKEGGEEAPGLLVTCWTVPKQRKDGLHFLVQTETGDVYKTRVDLHEGRQPVSMQVTLFESLPPAVCIVALKPDLLFLASETGDHGLYRVIPKEQLDPSVAALRVSPCNHSDMEEAEGAITAFNPTGYLVHLERMKEAFTLTSLAPATQLEIFSQPTACGPTDAQGPSQEVALCIACGAGPRSSIRVLRPGLATKHLAGAELGLWGAGAHAIFAVRHRFLQGQGGASDTRFLVYPRAESSDASASLWVMDVKDTDEILHASEENAFEKEATTLFVGNLADDSIVQIHQFGFRQIAPVDAMTGVERVEDWSFNQLQDGHLRDTLRHASVKTGCVSQDGRLLVMGVDTGAPNDDRLLMFELQRARTDGGWPGGDSGLLGEGGETERGEWVQLTDPRVEPGSFDTGAAITCVAAFKHMVAYGHQDGRVVLLRRRGAGGVSVWEKVQPQQGFNMGTLAPDMPTSIFLGSVGANLPSEAEPIPAGEVNLFIGTKLGRLVRYPVAPSVMDGGTSGGLLLLGEGEKGESRTLQGASHVTLAEVAAGGRTALTAFTGSKEGGPKSWLIYADPRMVMNPGHSPRLLYVPLSVKKAGGGEGAPPQGPPSVFFCAPFFFQNLDGESIAFVARDPGSDSISFLITRIQSLDEKFCEQRFDLSFTPRKMVPLPSHDPEIDLTGDVEQAETASSAESGAKRTVLAILETDHQAYTKTTQTKIKELLRPLGQAFSGSPSEASQRDDRQCGALRAGPGWWASEITVLDVGGDPAKALLSKVCLPQNEAAFCCAVVDFASKDLDFKEKKTRTLVVGTVTNMCPSPLKIPEASLRVYTWDSDFRLSLLHTTPFDGGHPLSLTAFGGKLLVGSSLSGTSGGSEREGDGEGSSKIGKLTLYCLGKQRLLRVCEYKNLRSGPVWMRAVGVRVFVGDRVGSFCVLNYGRVRNRFTLLCEDIVPRWLTCGETVDSLTVMGGDSFGNFFMNRIPGDVISSFNTAAANVEEVNASDRHWVEGRSDAGLNSGRCHKLDQEAAFHLGEVIMGVREVPTSGCLVALGLCGGLTGFVPLLSKEERGELQRLEAAMQVASPNLLQLAGRSHADYRSATFPVQNAVDGALCERFFHLPTAAQRAVAVRVCAPRPGVGVLHGGDAGPEECVSRVFKTLESLRERCFGRKISEVVRASPPLRLCSFGISVQSLFCLFVVLGSLLFEFPAGQAPHPHSSPQTALNLSDRFSPALSEGTETISMEGNSEGATGDPDFSEYGGSSSRPGVWFSLCLPQASRPVGVSVDTCTGTMADTVMDMVSGVACPSDSSTCVYEGWNDDHCDVQSRVSLVKSAGSEIFILVRPYDSRDDDGTFKLTVTFSVPYPHNSVQTAFELSDRFSPVGNEGVQTTFVEGVWLEATGDPDFSKCGGESSLPGVWFSLAVPPSSGPLAVSLFTSARAVVGVLSGTGCPSDSFAYECKGWADYRALPWASLERGRSKLFVLVHPHGQQERGNFNLTMTLSTPHPHDSVQTTFDLSDRFSPTLMEGTETTSVEGNWEGATEDGEFGECGGSASRPGTHTAIGVVSGTRYPSDSSVCQHKGWDGKWDDAKHLSSCGNGRSSRVSFVERGGVEVFVIVGQRGDGSGFNLTITVGLPEATRPTHLIAQGRRHSLAVSDQGEVFVFGSNDRGQLGLDDLGNFRVPTRVPSLSDIVDVCGGGEEA
uniref:Cleavage/polyadenylation specificity factor A subunit N-terminal domain-containing protein n=1 Tax=Chromera velia CCMP2878 TaxID=1169474 RepID=A0A0G4ICA2_9ALVE|eukprot:Cvel_13067.t1-p1 / transcript=Cvel_13067.t1 / gene=Cvel_13067 / organism=Chromera_velia_CCMP2878 / gene_product=Splicing factor 3B subunit 3, putative / transcript_product=Splicing factor 3B subunit 3, putative / location=Cvel_scaffold879:38527-61195(-) / protein_length=2023 / sequence_SO=supercontig / SO=protein_coding / is_pseudo=false